MPDDDLEQIADQNDFHVNSKDNGKGKLGSLSKRSRSNMWKLRHMLGRKRKKKPITLPNQQNQP